jgi:catechol 2,3-dioxygenase-like lactoylglutathione lyase family enzyme
MVHDVQAAVAFYTTHLGFTPNTAFLPAFAHEASIDRLDLSGGQARRLLLN